jgi:hypothetical protein
VVPRYVAIPSRGTSRNSFARCPTSRFPRVISGSYPPSLRRLHVLSPSQSQTGAVSAATRMTWRALPGRSGTRCPMVRAL